MRVEIRQLQLLDVLALDQQPNVEGQFGIYEPIKNIRHGIELQAMGPAWSAIGEDGSVLCCAGFGHVFADVQASAWAMFSRQFAGSVRAQAAVMQFMRAQICASPFCRIEALCRDAYPAEGRWLERVGFERRVLLRKWGPHSEDYWLFERVS
jgi:hypothetical protein